MGYVWNNGEITTNESFIPEVVDLVNSYFYEDVCNEDSIIFEDYCNLYLEKRLKDVIEVIKPYGYILNGWIKYEGDYEGSIEVKNNEVNLISAAETIIRWTSDEDLISELESRGYTVTKKER